MRGRVTSLYLHIVAAPQDRTILRDQTRSDRQPALGHALFRLLNGDEEAWVFIHYSLDGVKSTS